MTMFRASCRAGAALALALVATTPALAGERTGFTAIASGDLAKAERMLTAERRIYPQRPELMLNLAAVYAKTNRSAEARALYTAVLDRPAVAMDLPNGMVLSSHAVASTGLNRLPGAQMATR
ncbi:hypothetical protein ASE75_13135 [Sphingomonas sp. Leaf17]|uniref:tetratricopeptide repeat protein n=1 Tax=Sphingomonas sp. Leaf17 TaxID=1735683 RepID=UPI0006F7A51C|nr:tetratricopeptide repeat protein [Sphingomonas sp. Leaf17]KQM63503.1 hypothetical protein ASE75_13135 [Sphingomonas sp. Leaf17]